MHCRASNIHLSTRKIKLHANQQKILLLKEGLNVVSPHFTTWVFKHYPEIYSKFTTLVSVQGQNEEQRPFVSVKGHFNLKFTTLSSQYKVKMKNNDPLVSVQGHFNLKFTTLSSQYKVKMKNNDPFVLVQGYFNLKFTTLSSQYKVKMKNNDPLVSVQAHFNPKFTTLSSQYKVSSNPKFTTSYLSTMSV